MNNICRVSLYLNINKPINNAHERKKRERENEHSSIEKIFYPPIRMKEKENLFIFRQSNYNSFERLINENEISSFH